MKVLVAERDVRSAETRQLLSSYAQELSERLGAPEASFKVEPGEFDRTSRGAFVVIVADGMPVACGGLRSHDETSAELKRLYVARSARGQGLGRWLVASLETLARACGYRRVVLDTAEGLAEARRLYQTMGYQSTEAFNDNPHAAFWFEKPFPLLDDELWEAFVGCTLPHRMWDHLSHVRTAWLHLRRYSLDEAHLRLRAAILRLNASHHVVESPERGYHETLTRAWLHCVKEAVDRDAEHVTGPIDSLAFCAVHGELLDRSFLLRFYDRDTLFSLHARAVFIPPGRAPNF